MLKSIKEMQEEERRWFRTPDKVSAKLAKGIKELFRSKGEGSGMDEEKEARHDKYRAIVSACRVGKSFPEEGSMAGLTLNQEAGFVPPKPRRLKAFLVPEVTVLMAFQVSQTEMRAGSKCYPYIADLPEDVKILWVYHMPDRLCFAFVLEHESFDELAFGDKIPEAVAGVDWHRFLIHEEPAPEDPIKPDLPRGGFF